MVQKDLNSCKELGVKIMRGVLQFQRLVMHLLTEWKVNLAVKPVWTRRPYKHSRIDLVSALEYT